MDKNFIIINNKVICDGYTIKMDNLSFILNEWHYKIENSEKKFMDMMMCSVLISSKKRPKKKPSYNE